MVTPRQVAELLGVHENWVYDQAASGELLSYKIGDTRRFDPEELGGWIAERREAERNRSAGRKRQARPRRPKSTMRPDDSQPRLFE